MAQSLRPKLFQRCSLFAGEQESGTRSQRAYENEPCWHGRCFERAFVESLLDRWMCPAFAAVLLALGGCGRDQPARFQPPPGAPTGRETLHQPAKLTSIESDQKDALGRPLRVSCESCHSLRETKPMPSRPEELKEFHQGLQFRHGELACTSCHQAEQPRSLHLATGEPLPMTEVVTLCAQCHGPQYRDFKAGAHGGMTGYWDLSRGDRTRNNCVSCHDPHTPKYAGAHPVMPPHNPSTRGEPETKEVRGHE